MGCDGANERVAGSVCAVTEAERRDWLALALVAGIGPQLREQLLSDLGTVGGVLDAPVSRLREVPGIGAVLARQIRRARESDAVQLEMDRCAEHGIRIVCPPEFPPLLQQIPDPPGVLFVRGELRAADELSVAIVGSRHATLYGQRQAARLAASLAQAGLTVVSGFARGIDITAHRAAWENGGRTLGVLASGVLDVYPPEHAAWVDAMLAQGALLSETPLSARPLPGMFPRRNRLIAGLSLGVIVVEAAERSGALISARLAGEQGREVFAVPGSVESRMSRGCHQLLRQGARLVETIDDVFEELGPLVREIVDRQGHRVRVPAELKLDEQQRSILDLLGGEPTSVDQLVRSSGLPVPRVLSTLSVLETRGLVQRLSGQMVLRRPTFTGKEAG